jgi:predicted RNA methylase
MTGRAIRDALRERQLIDDAAFDQMYGVHVSRLSTVHWTPIAVALRAAALLAPEPGMRVLDVGAGPGKLCCVGALGFGGHWHGVEHNPALVAAAIATASCLELEDVTRFVAGDMAAVDWSQYDSLYFYNPFESVMFAPPHGLGDAGAALFTERVARAERHLAALRPGTRVVTYHGFGGQMPASFARVITECFEDGELVLWIQHRARGSATG